MKYIFPFHYLLIVVSALSGCTSISSTSSTPTQTEVQQPSRTPILPTSTSTFTPVPAHTETMTLTIPVTLEPDQVKETIRTFLQGPTDCLSPCFWGIIPGQTTLGEAQNIFTRLGLQLELIVTEGSKRFYGVIYRFDDGLEISPVLAIQDNVVKNFDVGIIPEARQPNIPREWLAYSPETLINQYGPPTQVGFTLDWGPRSFFDMVMYFDTVDLIVEYSGYDIIPRKKGSPQVCPLTDQFDSVHLWIGKSPVHPPAYAVPLEEATSMAIEEFSNLMVGINNACFIVKEEAFP